MHAPMPQKHLEPQAEAHRAGSFERAPWLAEERFVEEPMRASGPPLPLANEEHVIDAPLDGEEIRRTG
jgi:hypothetical protein